MSQRNKLAFRDDLANLDWNEMYHLSETQAAFGWFHSKLLLLCNKHFPKQKVKLKYNTRKMWLTQDATKNKRCHENKNKLYKKYLNIPSAANEVKYTCEMK